MERVEFILAGSGGQGLVMMGILIGQAASADGHFVAQTQTYGIATRGGVSYSEVVISDEAIIYPKSTVPNLILTLTEETYHLFRSKYPEAYIVADDEFVISAGDEHAVALPLTRYCREKGDMRILNMLAIGVVQGVYGVISEVAMERTITERFPKAKQANLDAYREGVKMAARVHGDLK